MIEIITVNSTETKAFAKGCDLCSNQKGLKQINFNTSDNKLFDSITLCENCLRQLRSRLDAIK